MITLVLAAMAVGALAVVVTFPIAAVIEWRNSRPERGNPPLAHARAHTGRGPERYDQLPTTRSPLELLAHRAAEATRNGLAWMWDDDPDTEAVRMADGRPVGWGDQCRPIRWDNGRPVWAPRWTLVPA